MAADDDNDDANWEGYVGEILKQHPDQKPIWDRPSGVTILPPDDGPLDHVPDAAVVSAGTALTATVLEQADDAGLWATDPMFDVGGAPSPVTASEAYVRARLRELHAAVEEFVEAATGDHYSASCPVCEGRAAAGEPSRAHCLGCLARKQGLVGGDP